ncbi:MAG: hypothetical protein E6J20_01885 [Chloroflexi bacterium]|nr:MAG: hypothetical protein E6J20_01885 [Chloroflexota bacterium]
MPHAYADARDKRIDFWTAFVVWIVANAICIVAISRVGSPAPGLIASAVLLLTNIAVPIVLAFTRSFAAMGILVAFATAFALTIAEGVFFTASDFAGGISNIRIQVGFLVAGLILFAIGAFFPLRAIHQSIR